MGEDSLGAAEGFVEVSQYQSYALSIEGSQQGVVVPRSQISLLLGPSLRLSFRTEAVTLETKNGQSVVRGVPCISLA